MDSTGRAQPPSSHAPGLTAALLAVWLAVSFGIGYFARELQFQVFGAPFSFWVAAQGGLLVYVAIICWHARALDRLDAGRCVDPPAAAPAERRPDVV